MESKKIFEALSADMKKFMELGEAWCDDKNINSAAQSRGYMKKIVKQSKAYIHASIKDAANVVVEEKVEEEVVDSAFKEVVEETEGETKFF